MVLYNKIPISRSWTRRSTPQKRNSASLFCERPRWNATKTTILKNLAEWSAVKFETKWRFRLGWPEIAQIKSHFRFRSAKHLARIKLSRFRSTICRLFFLPLIVSLFLNDRKYFENKKLRTEYKFIWWNVFVWNILFKILLLNFEFSNLVKKINYY